MYSQLLERIRTIFPLSHGGYDKAHIELSLTILEVFWCGCLSQMKENRFIREGVTAYPAGTTDAFRSIIMNTFDIARQYAPVDEQRRQQQQ
jgi:hypothetical protein